MDATLFTRVARTTDTRVPKCCKQLANKNACKNNGIYVNNDDGCHYCGVHVNAMQKKRNTNAIPYVFCTHETNQGHICLNRGKFPHTDRDGTQVFYCGVHKTDKNKEIHECAICITNIDPRVKKGEEKAYTTTPCKHHFHRGCIAKWVQTGKRSCPLCRAQLRNLPRAPEPTNQPDDDGFTFVETEIDPLSYRPFDVSYPLDAAESELIETPANYWDFVRFSLGLIMPSPIQRDYFSRLMHTSQNLREMFSLYNNTLSEPMNHDDHEFVFTTTYPPF